MEESYNTEKSKSDTVLKLIVLGFILKYVIFPKGDLTS